jgi:hypothetical protein
LGELPAALALASGHAVLDARGPEGPVVARALELVAGADSTGEILIDTSAAELLPAGGLVTPTARGLRLDGFEPESSLDPPAAVFGRAAPFVGRERMLAALVGQYESCLREPCALPVLITAPAGAGKSRLASELRARLLRHERPPEIWVSRADPGRAGSPFGVLAPFLRRLTEGEPGPDELERLRRRLIAHMPGACATGTLPDLDLTDTDDRGCLDPLVAGEQLLHAWEELIAAEAAARPLLVIVDDLHWGDLPSVRYLGAALRRAGDLPLMVLALARPDVPRSFLDLWAERGLQSFTLEPLSPRASAQLVRALLGPGGSAERVDLIVASGHGNALHLAELVRAALSDEGTPVPDTVLAMLAARFEQLDPHARRILRAGSVFGRSFWPGGIEALTGAPRADVEAFLAYLVRRELIAPAPRSRFAGEVEYVFGHDLLRETAYAMLPAADRAAAHRAAAAWLEGHGEEDALALAEHLERGGALAEGSVHLHRAALDALRGDDFAEAAARAERGLAVAAAGLPRAALHSVVAEARIWTGQLEAAEAAAWAGLAEAPEGSRVWFEIIAQLSSLLPATQAAATEVFARAADVLDTWTVEAADADAILAAVGRAAFHMFMSEPRHAGPRLLAALERPQARAGSMNPSTLGMLEAARAGGAAAAGDIERAAAAYAAAAAHHLDAGSRRLAALYCNNAGAMLVELGAYAEAEPLLARGLELATAAESRRVRAALLDSLADAKARSGDLAAAEMLLTCAIELEHGLDSRRLRGGLAVHRAELLLARGDLDAAEASARDACADYASWPRLRSVAAATLARVHLAQGRVDLARAAAREAKALLDEHGVEEREAVIRLVDALTRDGDDGRRARAEAARWVRSRAERLDAHRAVFLAIAENVRLLQLAG